MDRSSKQEMNKEIWILNDTLDQMNIISIDRAFHPRKAEYTFFSSANVVFSRINHLLGYKTSLNKFKRSEIISNMKSCHITDNNDLNWKLTAKKKKQ